MGTGFRQLKVWQEAKTLAVDVYRLCQRPPLARDFGLRDQLCRASVSIASNLAEGDERGSDRDSARFFMIAKGSIAEVRTQLEIASSVGLLGETTQSALDARLESLARGVGALIRARTGAVGER
jgi:four helix bundle protein